MTLVDRSGQSGAEQPVPRYLRVSGVLAPDNRLVLRPSYLTERARGARDIEGSPLQILLFAGTSLALRWGVWVGEYSDAESRVRADRPRIGQGPEALFRPVRAKVPFPPETDRIVFKYGDVVVGEIRVPAQGPTIEQVEVTRTDDAWLVRWVASHPDKGQRLFYHVRTTADGGRTWGRLGSRLTASELRVPTDGIAGGDACIVQVVAYDGVNTVSRDVVVPRAPAPSLQIRIVSPAERKEPYTAPVSLIAMGRIPGRAGLLADLARWTWLADGQQIADGPTAEWSDPAPGRHEIVLTARADRLEARAEVTIVVAERQAVEPKKASR